MAAAIEKRIERCIESGIVNREIDISKGHAKRATIGTKNILKEPTPNMPSTEQSKTEQLRKVRHVKNAERLHEVLWDIIPITRKNWW
jgi:hypothetical protein